MRRSEFHRAIDLEFEGRASAVLHDLILTGLGSQAAAEALDAGVPPRTIWNAVCEEMDVPANRRYGAGRLEPRQR